MPPNNIIEIRKMNAAESILGNESLTADLDDQSANALLAWSLDCIDHIADATIGLDDQSADIFINEKVRTVSRLMRNVNNWVTEITTDQSTNLPTNLEKILQHASLVYGPNYRLPDQVDVQIFIQHIHEMSTDKKTIILSLREMIETRLSP